VKLSEGRKQVHQAARGEASFRKPKDALFSKQVHQAARGEANFIKPPEVKLLSETSSSSRAFRRKPKEQVELLTESRHPARGEASRRKPKDAARG